MSKVLIFLKSPPLNWLKAIVSGVLFAKVMFFIASQLLGIVFLLWVYPKKLSTSKEILELVINNNIFLISSIVLSSFIAFFAGFITGLIANNRKMFYSGITSIIGMLIVSISDNPYLNEVIVFIPVWLYLIGIILDPLCCMFGGYIAEKIESNRFL